MIPLSYISNFMYVKIDLTAVNGASCLQEPLVEEGSEDESDVESPVKRGSAEAEHRDSRPQLTGSQVKRAAQGQGRISPSRLQKSTRQEDAGAEAAPARPSQRADGNTVQGSSGAGIAASQPETVGNAEQSNISQTSSGAGISPAQRAQGTGRSTQTSDSQESSGTQTAPSEPPEKASSGAQRSTLHESNGARSPPPQPSEQAGSPAQQSQERRTV